jgi:hypothetical protein
MPRKFALGLGLVGIISGPLLGQSAADRPPVLPSPATAPPPGPVMPAASGTSGASGTPAASGASGTPGTPGASAASGTPGRVLPASASGVKPIEPVSSPGAYVPPVGVAGLPASPPASPPASSSPPEVEVPSALGPNHPWALKPEHGAYFICVKSYSRPSKPDPNDPGPSARELAEALAGEIRELYRVQAFLFEYISEERKAEAAAVAAARERARLFAAQLEKYKQQAQLNGMTFLEDDRLKVYYKTVNYRDQIAVLVGGFATAEDARKALDKVRTWPPPKNKLLMDGAAIVRPGKDGKPVLEEGHINPYLTAHVVPNPLLARSARSGSGPAETGLDPFIVKLNEGRPYNLLQATKGWTLAVKSFSAPVEIVGRNDSSGLMRRPTGSRGADVLQAGAQQAEALAAALRELKGKAGEPLGLEAFVLHTRGASIVTVGQFDGPNDPALLQTRQLLSTIRFNVTEDRSGLRPVANAPSLFGTLMPMPIPRP